MFGETSSLFLFSTYFYPLDLYRPNISHFQHKSKHILSHFVKPIFPDLRADCYQLSKRA